MPRPNDVGVGVSVLIVRVDWPSLEHKVLLGKRRGAHGAGCWSPPGGWVDRSDASIEAACAREVFEETGMKGFSSTRMLFEHMEDYPEHGFKAVTLFRVAGWVSGEPSVVEPDKCEEWRWFSLNDLPEPLFGGVGQAVNILIEELRRANERFDAEELKMRGDR